MEYQHLPLLVVPQGITFLLSSRLDSAVKRCSSEVLKLSFQRSCTVRVFSCPNRLLIRSEIVGVAKAANN